MGLFQFICSVYFQQLVIFKKNRYGEIFNSGSQSNSKVQPTLKWIINNLYKIVGCSETSQALMHACLKNTIIIIIMI